MKRWRLLHRLRLYSSSHVPFPVTRGSRAGIATRVFPRRRSRWSRSPAPSLCACFAAVVDAPTDDEAPPRDIVVITGEKPVAETQPATTETRSAEEIHDTTNVLNAEDALRYLPNIHRAQAPCGRHAGADHHAHLGVGASARSLIYVDGLLISA